MYALGCIVGCSGMDVWCGVMNECSVVMDIWMD